MNSSNRIDVVQIVEPTVHSPNLPRLEPEPSLIIVVVDALRVVRAYGHDLVIETEADPA
jgi:hypothetical protein